jgi:hypothetical protein
MSRASMEALLRRNADACESARWPVCTCRCGGALHGVRHTEGWIQEQAEMIEREAAAQKQNGPQGTAIPAGGAPPMTPLRKAVSRVSSGNGVNRRHFVVTLAPGDMIGFRDVRTRPTYWTSLAHCYGLAVRQQVAKDRAERMAKRSAHA